MVNVRKYTSPMDALGHQKITTESAGNIWGMLQAAWWLVLHACSGMILAEFVLDVFFLKLKLLYIYVVETIKLWNDTIPLKWFVLL